MRLSNALIEKRRPAFFAAGLLFAISLTLVSFEWRTPYVEPEVWEFEGSIDEEQIYIPVTLQEPEKVVERPEPPKTEPNPTQLVVIDEPVPEPKDDFDPAEIEIPNDVIITNEPPEPSVPEVDLGPRTFSEIMPKYCAGEAEMLNFLGENLNYPRIPLENGVSGTVHIKFVVDKSGKLRDAKVLKPVDPWLDAEALRVAKMLECFTPGIQGGHKVDVYFVLPVRFAIN